MSTPITIIENDVKSLRTPMEREMEKTVKHFDVELAKLRTGKAPVAAVEDLKIVAYDALSIVKAQAQVNSPDPRLIIIQPYDAKLIGEIEKSILASDLGVNPANDGKVIRLQFPEMSKARREEMVKILHKKLEEGRTSLRNTRKDFNNLIRDAKKNKKISEDFSNRLADVLQEVTDQFIKKIEQIAQAKEKNILTI